MRLEQRRLGLGRGPVDLVADHDVREDRPGLELELAPFLVVGVDPGDVARQQVGRELNAPHRAVDGPGEGLGEHRLADAGHVLDEQVPFGQQHDQREPDGLGLAVDDRLDGRADLVRRCHQVIERPLLPAPRVEYQKALLEKARLVRSPTCNRILRRRLQTVCRATPKCHARSGDGDVSAPADGSARAAGKRLPRPALVGEMGRMGHQLRDARSEAFLPPLRSTVAELGICGAERAARQVWTGAGGGMWSTVGRGGVRWPSKLGSLGGWR